MNIMTQKEQLHRSASTVSPQFLLRVGGLPINLIDDLRFPKLIAWVKALITIEEQLNSLKEPLVDALHEAINSHKENQELRRKLLSLKRDVFNMRQPSNLHSIRKITEQMNNQEGQRLVQWFVLWEQYQHVQKEGASIFSREMQVKRSQLKDIINIPDFRKGILLSSPLLDQAIDSYIASDNLQLQRSARTIERSLIEYLLRTACKTSPFSTFTSVNAGIIERTRTTAQPDILLHDVDMEKRSFARLNMALLSLLSHMIMEYLDLRDELPIQITSGWSREHNRIRYLRNKTSIDEIDEEKPMVLDRRQESIIYLPEGRILHSLLALMGNGCTLKFGEVVSRLCSRENNNLAINEESEVREYLCHLLRLGLLFVPCLQPDIHDPHPIRSYSQNLRTISSPIIEQVASSLEEADRLTDTYATAELEERRRILKEIKQQVKSCFNGLGSPQTQIPRTLIYEDTTIKSAVLAIHEQKWEELFSDVAAFQRILPAFDINLPRRLVTKGYFRARYGSGARCDNFLAFAEEFYRDFLEHYMRNGNNQGKFDREKGYVPGENHFHMRDLDMIDDTRKAIAEYISNAYAGLPPGSKELLLGEDFLETVVPHVPLNIGHMQSHTYFAQLAHEAEKPLLVINRVYTGLTSMFSRFAHCFSEEEKHWLVPSLRTTLENLQPEQSVFAELKGGYTSTNLNLHPHFTQYELVCSGEVSTRPLEAQITLDDLYIQDDPDADMLRLFSRRLGKEVIPVYLGFLFPMALPEIQQVLLNFTYTTMCPIYMWQGTKAPVAGHAIASYPRIRYKNLVLHRALWKMHPDYMPKRESGQSDLDFFVTYQRWRQQNQIPSRIFVTPDTSDTQRGANSDEMELRRPSHKPLYVDFDNVFSVMLLEATVRGTSQRLVMTEMLPHSDHLWFKQGEQQYVSEFIFEMNSFPLGGLHG